MNIVPIISARKLRFSYAPDRERTRVLRALTLTVAPGEVVVVTGASGAGKTTLLTLCAALRSVQDGELWVLRKNLGALSQVEQRELRSSIGFIFQSHNLIDALTAGQNVVMSLLGRLSSAEASQQAEAALASLGLAARVDHLPEELSGGEKQRVAVARALVRSPELLLADEPTASLDAVSADLVKRSISDAARLSGCAVLLVTHDLRLFEIADRVFNLVDGVLMEAPFGVFANPNGLHAKQCEELSGCCR